MSIEIEFKNPPARTEWKREVSPETAAILATLEAHPGEWALIKKDVNVSVSTWWKKRPGLEAKASTIGKPKSKCDVYARYVGKAA